MIRHLVLVIVFALGCAGAPRTDARTPGRIKDSPAEKVAAHRAASGGLRLEQEDERWGLEAARERRLDRRGTPKTPPPPSPLPARDDASTQRIQKPGLRTLFPRVP